MLIAGITAEYDPFHNGHAFHISETKKAGADAVVSVMSSYFTQRGEPSLLTKEARARAALRGGADLVLELPAVWACGKAQSFARGAAAILNGLGNIDMISFGSECGDEKLIRSAVDALKTPEVDSLIREKLSGGVTYAVAREKAVKEIAGKNVAGVLKNPNDTLAAEYMA
ncbi:MAG: nucleotidyltransferase family protein, partial [Clostridiales bacterium]|nr:nucleotidyltransferase family protein [Clostridiales bacterium]